MTWEERWGLWVFSMPGSSLTENSMHSLGSLEHIIKTVTEHDPSLVYGWGIRYSFLGHMAPFRVEARPHASWKVLHFGAKPFI